MPLFGGKDHRRNASNSSSSSPNTPRSPRGYETRSPPPPYSSPQLQHQHLVQGPYSAPQYTQRPPPWPATSPYQYHPAPTTSTHLPLPPSQSRYGQHANSSHQRPRWASTANLVDTSCPIVNRTVEYLTHGAAMCDLIGDKFSDVISRIDDETFAGTEQDLVVTFDQHCYVSQPPLTRQESKAALRRRGRQEISWSDPYKQSPMVEGERGAPKKIVRDIWPKATMYANSYLPPNLPPFRVYMPTWPLLCLAAQYSRDAYQKPKYPEERNTFMDASCKLGTKAMVIKSVPKDDLNVIVFAIRGTSLLSFGDWAVNWHTAPASPEGFLDDPGNLCHAGFLDVARKMVRPVAARLRQLLEQNPSRASFSLLITGHSAGGAVASLLFAHMLSETVKSELSILTNCFKRIHCTAFGAPPVTLLPLAKPLGAERRLRKSLFVSFINEGDPVCRMEKPYLRSLLDVYASPAPKTLDRPLAITASAPGSTSKVNLFSKKQDRPRLSPRSNSAPTSDVLPMSNVVWRVPPTTLSNAGRIVVLRVPRGGSSSSVKACITTDAQLRGVIFGDVAMHHMSVYLRRIEVLATRAATAGLKN